MKKRPKYEQFPIPKLDEETKKKNGSSSRKLHKTITALDDCINEKNKKNTDDPDIIAE